MNRPFANRPPSRPVRTRIEGVRVPASLRHLLGGGGGYDYTEPRCRVCMHEDREIIESMLLAGKAYTLIAGQIPPRQTRAQVRPAFDQLARSKAPRTAATGWQARE